MAKELGQSPIPKHDSLADRIPTIRKSTEIISVSGSRYLIRNRIGKVEKSRKTQEKGGRGKDEGVKERRWESAK